MKRLVLLGASGSIGTQTIDIVLQHPDQFSIVALSVGRNIEKLKEILAVYPVSFVCVQDPKDVGDLQLVYPDISFTAGDDGLISLVENCEYDLLVNALVGITGFLPTLRAIENGHDVALANKETLVCGGALIDQALRKYGRRLLPIDSEHSAIFQCLQGNDIDSVKKLIITASGGAFRKLDRSQLGSVTLEQALAHPNWSMGEKITIDCANMMNKGFEVTEAHWLFGIDYDRIDVLMHAESVIHSMVEYVDHSVIAQLGAPDMRLPIQYALTWPQRIEWQLDHPLDLAEIGELHFSKPDVRRYPLLALAYECGRKGGNLSAVMNAANDAANTAFRAGKIPFLKIEDIVISAVYHAPYHELTSVDDLMEAIKWGNQYAEDRIREESV